MFGIIIADHDEIALLLKKIKNHIIEFNNTKFYLLEKNNIKIPLCFCGNGKVNAAAITMNMINNFNVNIVFNIGVCGAKETIKIGTPIIANSFQYFDVDVTEFKYKLNEIPKEDINILVKKKYLEETYKILSKNEEKPIIGTIATGDSIISKNNYKKFVSLSKQEILGFDMESMAIASICKKNKVDFFAIKYVSDNLYHDEINSIYHTNLKEIAKKIDDTIIKILDFYAFCK